MAIVLNVSSRKRKPPALEYALWMRSTEPALEWLRLSEHYRRMTDEELLTLASESPNLTDNARQVLASEMSHRGLNAVAKKPSPPTLVPADSTYDADRELVELSTVWSLRDALDVQTLLDRAGIPFFLGPENSTRVAAVSNFGSGVSVAVMRVGLPWAQQAIKHFKPQDLPDPRQPEEAQFEMRCPRCHSADVILEGLVAETGDEAENSVRKYTWSCDMCQHEWQDEGVLGEE
jgi:hypothetical protein